MIVCIACIGIESSRKKDLVNSNEDSDENGMSKVVSCFLAIFLGLCAAMLMSIKHMIIRNFKNSGYAGFDQALDSNILEGIIQSFFLIHLLKRSDYDFKWTDLLRSSIAVFGIGMGRILIAIGVAEGIAGPA